MCEVFKRALGKKEGMPQIFENTMMTASIKAMADRILFCQS